MTDQLTDADVAALRAAGKNDELEAARKAGKLNDLLGITAHQPPEGQWTSDDVTAMYRERRYIEIEAARVAGHLNQLLAGDGDTAA